MKARAGAAAEPPARGRGEPATWAQLYPTLVAVVAALGLLVRMVNLMLLIRARYPLVDEAILDASIYERWALAILQGGEAARRTFFFPPLFAYVLAGLFGLVGYRPMAVPVFNTALDALNVVLVCIAGARAFGRRVGLLAGAFYALYVPALFHATTPFKTTVEVFTGLVLLLFLVNADRRPTAWNWAGSGLSLAVASLARPNLLVLGPVLPLMALVARRRVGWRRALACALLAAAALGAVLGGVVARNLAVLGEPGLFTNGGIAFYLSVNNFTRPDFLPGDPEVEEQVFLEEYLRRSGKDEATSSESSAYWMRQAVRIFRARPLRFLNLLVLRLVIFFNRAEIGDCYSLELAAEKSPLLRLPLFTWGTLAPLALAAATLGWGSGFRLSRRAAAAGTEAGPPRSSFWPYCLLLLSYTLSLATIFPVDRYRLPAVPQVVTLASWAVWALVAAARRSWGPPRRRWAAWAMLAGWLLFIAAAGLFVNLRVGFYDFDGNLGQHLLNLGDVLATGGRLEEAEAYDLRALRLWPENPRVHYSLGLIRLKRGRPGEAVASLERAVSLDPSNDDYHRALAEARRAAAEAAATPGPSTGGAAPGGG
ncbi:MAG: tetratricopeptide repeat protein [Acetobacteraceae bacterium]|nr:tetratricopeptide repeat protein [Acetobacteraceae bacterium]